MQSRCWLALAVALALTCGTNAKVFKCAVSWRVNGLSLGEGTVSGTSCQQQCEKNPACKFFYVTEDVNAPQVGRCHVMGTVYAEKYRDDAVLVVCAYPKVWPQIGATAITAGTTGTLIPASALSAKSGSYRRVSSSTGVVAIHATMIPNTDDIVVFGRPQDPKYPPQPGMEVGNSGVEWPSAIVNAKSGAHRPIPWNMGAPFCAHQVHTVNGDILVCGGDDDFIGQPGNGEWGGSKGCRYLTKDKKTGQMAWYKFGDMSGGHWYPSIVELPPGVSGSKGTCALVMGGLQKAPYPVYLPTDKVDMACLQMGLTFGGSVYTHSSTPNVAESLRQQFPIAFLLPVGDVPAAPQIALFGEVSGDVVTLGIDFKKYNFYLTSIKYIPPAPIKQFTFTAPSSSVLKAINLAGPVDKRTIEIIVFGGAYYPTGPFQALDKVFRVKPLADNPGWEEEKMPTPAVMRWAINLPNGKILLVGGARLGKAGGGRICCTSLAGGPIMNVWMYDPARPNGRRFWVDPVMMPRYRLYHSTAWLGRDGSIYLAGGDQAVIPNNRPDFTMDAYVTPAMRKASKQGVRPFIISAPRKFKYGNKLTVKLRGGYASRCSLSKPVAATHATASSHRMLLLKTVKNAMNKKVVKKGGYLVVATPKSAYVAPPGWWLLYCWHGDVWTSGSWIYLTPK